jgi:hypothetical protein
MHREAGPVTGATNSQNGVALNPAILLMGKEQVSPLMRQLRQKDDELKTLHKLLVLEKDPVWRRDIGRAYFLALREIDRLVAELEGKPHIAIQEPETKKGNDNGNGGMRGFLSHFWPFHKKNGNGNGGNGHTPPL